MNESVLVTGGAGFIGSHTVVELFNSGFNPVIVDDLRNSAQTILDGLKKILGQDIPYYSIDCSNFHGIKKVIDYHEIKNVIHFAAYKSVGESVKMPIKYYKNNIGSLLNILEVLEECGVQNLVFSSSCTIYGQPDIIPVKETSIKKRTESPYGNTKAISERILEDFIQSGQQKKIVSLRYFNPVGAHDSGLIGELPNGTPSNLIPYITQSAIGKRQKLVVFGNDYHTEDGSNIRDYVHVMDVARAHVLALELLKKMGDNFYDVFNLGSGVGYSVLQVVKTFEKVNGIKLNYEIGQRRTGDVEKIFANIDKAKEFLNWTPQRSLEVALRDSWNWECNLSKLESNY
jgi:UDP-glucose 4-epimerase